MTREGLVKITEYKALCNIIALFMKITCVPSHWKLKVLWAL